MMRIEPRSDVSFFTIFSSGLPMMDETEKMHLDCRSIIECFPFRGTLPRLFDRVASR